MVKPFLAALLLSCACAHRPTPLIPRPNPLTQDCGQVCTEQGCWKIICSSILREANIDHVDTTKIHRLPVGRIEHEDGGLDCVDDTRLIREPVARGRE